MKKCLASGQQKKRLLFLSNEVSENPNHGLVSLPEIALLGKGKKVQAEKNYSY